MIRILILGFLIWVIITEVAYADFENFENDWVLDKEETTFLKVKKLIQQGDLKEASKLAAKFSGKMKQFYKGKNAGDWYRERWYQLNSYLINAFPYPQTDIRYCKYAAKSALKVGLILKIQKKYPEAIKEFSKLLKSQVNDRDPSPYIMEIYRNYRPRAQWEIGNCYFKMKEYQQALSAYQVTKKKISI